MDLSQIYNRGGPYSSHQLDGLNLRITPLWNTHWEEQKFEYQQPRQGLIDLNRREPINIPLVSEQPLPDPRLEIPPWRLTPIDVNMGPIYPPRNIESINVQKTVTTLAKTTPPRQPNTY